MEIQLLVDIQEVINVHHKHSGQMMLYVTVQKQILPLVNTVDGVTTIVIGKMNVLNLFVLQEQLFLELFN